MPGMRAALFCIALGLATSLPGCTSSRSGRCIDVCEREAQCVDKTGFKTDIPFDRTECVAACTALERDPAGRTLVDKHQACVQGAGTCSEVVRCP
jgi:hypothetical protein